MTMHNDNSVSVAPTKQFFISVLVKDIYLIDAIVELVDNSVDAARTKYGKSGIGHVTIEISFDANRFFISDNAGGISIEQAREYAFRFGRPDKAPKTPGTVGEFGVGMKRALFKLGDYFDVYSRTTEEFFRIPVDVPAWKSLNEEDPNAWKFEFSETGENPNPSDVGTSIEVTKLFSHVAEEFADVSFGTRLTNLLKEAHNESLSAGLQITVNNQPVHGVTPALLQSNSLYPTRQDLEFEILGKGVKVTIIAGVGDPSLPEAGWYMFCNGRQIARADKSENTGWNLAIDGETTPKAHWQYRRFRGYVFFESPHADVLPWNTTKTSLNVESPAYRRILPDMQAALRQVIAFLNALDNEGNDGGPLTDIIDSASKATIAHIAASPSFRYVAAAPSAPRPKTTRISFARDAEIVDRVKSHAGVRSNREIGEYTFDYFVDNEGLNG
jgi:hypothetical protein